MTAMTSATMMARATMLTQYVDIDDVAAATRQSHWTIRRWVREGKFPKPRRVGRKLLWPANEVEQHLAGAA
jgi:predicted DNA-binding transcriptional regulator AlpA